MPSLLPPLPSLPTTRNLAILSLTAGVVSLTFILLRAGDAHALRNSLSHPWYIDTANHPFQHPIRPGQPTPTTSPAGLPAYPAELCFWTAEGHPKSSPTYVLLNAYQGNPAPTYCPDCNRLVLPNNPPPLPQQPAPPKHPATLTPPATQEAPHAP